METSILRIIFFIIGIASILCSIGVTSTVYKFGAKTSSARLIMYLHIAQVIEGISILPDIVTVNNCNLVLFIRNYSVIFKLFSVLLMFYLTNLILFKDQSKVDIKRRYQLPIIMEIILFIFPFTSIVSLFISQDNEEYERLGFCHIHSTWENILVKIPITLILATSLFFFSYLLYKLRSAEADMKLSIYSGIGSYALITLSTWVIRSIIKALDQAENKQVDFLYYLDFLCVYIAGFGYCYVFLGEKNFLKAFECFFKENIDDNNYNLSLFSDESLDFSSCSDPSNNHPSVSLVKVIKHENPNYISQI
jgi:hypothetical protein